MRNLGSVQLIVALEPILCATLVGVLIWRKQVGNNPFFTAYAALRLTSWLLLTSLLYSIGWHLSHLVIYEIYFYLYWISFAVEAILSLCIVYELYKLAMAPLPGLQRLGMLMFRWAAGIATIVAVGLAAGPHTTGVHFIVKSVLQLQQTEAILTLCLLLFVTFAIRPMGLSYQSRIFGVSLGLAILSTSDLVASAWLSHMTNMASTVNVLTGVAFTAAVCIWITYYLIPEPKRQLIVLPTTSPFLRWNQISLALGDAPGFVAVGGLDPSFLAPAEVEVMERASVKMKLLAYK